MKHVPQGFNIDTNWNIKSRRGFAKRLLSFLRPLKGQAGSLNDLITIYSIEDLAPSMHCNFGLRNTIPNMMMMMMTKNDKKSENIQNFT